MFWDDLHFDTGGLNPAKSLINLDIRLFSGYRAGEKVMSKKGPNLSPSVSPLNAQLGNGTAR